ncbi:small ubiquitin-related modifier 2-like [Puma concolor]|uniref:Small ubiquitin-related modifier 2-like n=1 Tax=Puma concolor TaxID=9696 RepID=A0A6P6HF21_PUMCO|nr:small ubiquitin-related modifier 2-like [Puma concolor]
MLQTDLLGVPAPSSTAASSFCSAPAAAKETLVFTVADEKPKEGVKTEDNYHINLKVTGQDGSMMQFKIKRHKPLSKLMKAYCEWQDKPAQLEMEDEDAIDVFQQQTAGIY